MATPSAVSLIRPVENPLTVASQALGYRSMLNQQQIQQEQAQGLATQNATAQIEQQQQALQLRSQQAWQKAFAQPINWDDPNAVQHLMSSAAQNGATGQSLVSMQQAMVQHQLANTKLSAEEQNLQNIRNDRMRAQLDSVFQADPSQRANLWKSYVDQNMQQGWLKPGEVPDVYPGDDQARMYANSLGLASVINKEAAANTSANARASQAQTAAQRLQTELPGIQAGNTIKSAEATAIQGAGGAYMPPDVADSVYRGLIAKQHGGQQLTPKEQDFIAGYTAQKTLVPKFNFNLNAGTFPNSIPPQNANLHGDAYLATLNPADRAIVQKIANGQMAFPSSYVMAREPYYKRIMPMVYQYDPAASEQRAQMRHSFLTGPTAQNIGNLNTAAVHLDTLGQLANALQNNDVRMFNRVGNAWATGTGKTAPTNFEAVKTAVAGELANALKGQATDAEIANIERSVDKQNSPAQLAGFVQSQLGIIHQKLSTYQQRWLAQSPGDTQFSDSLVLPQARQVFQQYGVHGEGGTAPAAAGIAVTAPNGKVYHFQSQAKAEQFKKLTGIQ